MDPITCPHPVCGYTWTPRKANPKKCPQCMNPLWQSPRPKKKVHEGSSSVVERPSVKIPDEQSDGKTEGGSSVQIPASPHSIPIDIATARAKAEELLKKLA